MLLWEELWSGKFIFGLVLIFFNSLSLDSTFKWYSWCSLITIVNYRVDLHQKVIGEKQIPNRQSLTTRDNILCLMYLSYLIEMGRKREELRNEKERRKSSESRENVLSYSLSKFLQQLGQSKAKTKSWELSLDLPCS